MTGADVRDVERTMLVLAQRSRVPFIYEDPSSDQRLSVTPEALASRVGFLPAIVAAGEAVWWEATGKGFALEIVRDPGALLGYRLRRIGAGGFAVVMLASMEAVEQVAGPAGVMVGELNAVWAAAKRRTRYEPGAAGIEQRGPRL